MNLKYVLGLSAPLAVAAVTVGFLYPFRHHEETLRLAGVVEVQEIRLGSKIGGRVAHVAAQEGDLVQPGQVLVEFEAPDVEAQRDQQAARISAAEARLDKARNGPRKEEIRQAHSDWESAEADLTFAVQDFARVEKLYRQATVSRVEFDTARAARDRARGRTASALARLDLLKAGTRSEEIAEAEANVAELRGKLREIEANLREAVVRAPYPSLVEVVAVRKGDLVPPNQTVVRVLRAEDLWVKVYVPETELGKVRVGQEVRVTIDAYPGRSFPGAVYQIAAESEFTPRNIQSLEERRHQVFGVRIRVPQPADPKQRVFKSGMAAEVFFTLSDEPGERGR
jgi:multidrug resistance efflux pump